MSVITEADIAPQTVGQHQCTRTSSCCTMYGVGTDELNYSESAFNMRVLMYVNSYSDKNGKG